MKIKCSSGLVKSLKSVTDNGMSSCSNFPERPTLEELEMDIRRNRIRRIGGAA